MRAAGAVSRNRWPLVLAIVLLVALKLWLIGGQCRPARAEMVHDDRLFVNLAASIADGRWLGEYNDLTLAKGPGYPLFLAACELTGFSAYLAQHLLYVAACLALLVAIAPWVGRRWVLGLAAAWLVLNPATWAAPPLLFLREGVYGSLLLMTTAALVALACRERLGRWAVVTWSIALGLSLAWIWVTREEAVEVAVPCGVAALAFLVLSRRRRSFDAVRPVVALLIPLVMLATVALTVRSLNRSAYGIPVTTEFRAPEFLSAYGALTRVRHARPRRLVPVPRETRLRIYPVSPAFAELRPFLEGPLGWGWAELGAFQLEGERVDEIAGGYFQWAFRDAVELAGHYGSGREAMDFYRRMASEIDRACADGRLSCGPPRATMRPPWRWSDLPAVGRTAAHYLRELVTMGRCHTPLGVVSTGDPAGIALFGFVSNDCIAPPAVSGRAGEAGGEDRGRVRLLVLVEEVYRLLMPVAVVAAVVVLGLVAARRVRRHDQLLAAVAVTGATLFAHLGVVVVAVALALPSLLERYLNPAWHLLPAVVVLILVLPWARREESV